MIDSFEYMYTAISNTTGKSEPDGNHDKKLALKAQSLCWQNAQHDGSGGTLVLFEVDGQRCGKTGKGLVRIGN